MSYKTPTKEQQEIIEATEGNIRVRAVPGSGKTFVLTNRIAYLITELGVEPSSVVAMTFTNKAAGEMKSRLKRMIGDMATCFAGTFHGFCNGLLKEEIYRVAYPKTFAILDKQDEINLLREIAQDLGLSLKDFTARDCMERICAQKQNPDYVEYMIGPDKEALTGLIAEAKDDFHKVYYHYLLRQRDNYALDFEDIIQFAIHILTKFPEALEKWRKKCQYLLCDEYQDVNGSQELLLTLLSGKYHNLTVVGDDDQCIYGWRGSDVGYMVDFDKTHDGVKDYYLEENFRSSPQIVDVANSLIRANRNRLAKAMYTKNIPGKKAVCACLKEESEEAEYIARTVREAVEQGGSYADHTVLVRAASQTRALEEAFLPAGIPYRILRGAQFYASEEIRTVLSYLRMVYSRNDLDFSYTIQRPRRGFGKKSVEKLKEYAAGRGLTLMQALGELIDAGEIRRKEVIAYYQEINRLHEIHETMSCRKLAGEILDLGYRKELEEDVEQERLDNVAEFLSTIAALEEENQDRLPLEDLLAHFALFTAQDEDTDRDAVRVMTIHTAKGLEFDTVFVCGLTEGLFPSRKLKNEDELEEERRLFYVAVTRAKRRLYLTRAIRRQGQIDAVPSCFLADIDGSLMEYVGCEQPVRHYATPQMLPEADFQAGDQVIHKVFGKGKVIGVDMVTRSYEIDFEKLNGTRNIVFRVRMERAEE
ncbi:MAG: UvrD-helicase domain-containing protein [Roseburia sp.]|nr:UvrD-helicase domain-containing protein [Roseburia sp.]MCM1098861.1 UvrD-helicase domain-containing protein [Ruminococcus flavefaciens]